VVPVGVGLMRNSSSQWVERVLRLVNRVRLPDTMNIRLLSVPSGRVVWVWGFRFPGTS
jgi:hypothetical protein